MGRMSSSRLAVIFACVAIACGGQHGHDGGHDARHDGTPADASARDAHVPDAGHADAPPAAGDAAHDAGSVGDAGHDAGSVTDARADAAPADAAHADAPHPDAPSPDASPPDAGTASPDAGGVTVACYSEGSPNATCSSPDHCCFTNYGSYHDGTCSTSSCSWGTIDCDGPEDCGAGQHCCSHATYDPELGVTGYKLACQSAACGTPPFDQELCHASATCPAGKTCVSAYGHDNDLPRALSICQ
jgi:hypothetical protein